MSKLKKLLNFGAGVVVASTLCGHAMAEGAIDVAIIGEPPTLDPMKSTADVVGIVTQHFFETLYAFDHEWKVAPLLAEGMPEISADGKTYTIKLRSGIKFHDGSSMDSADVVASLNRWMKVANRGKAVAGKVESIVAVDSHTVKISLSESYSPLLGVLAFTNSAAIVIPEEVIDGNSDLKALVGTGPYLLKEHIPDRYIQTVKYNGYVSRKEAPDGAAGGRLQTLDEIRFVPVPDANTRAEGILSGLYTYGDSLPPEALPRLEEAKNVEPVMLDGFGWPLFASNMKKGLMSDVNIRKAVQYALNEEDMLYGAFGNEKFFSVSAPQYPERFFWHTSEGAEPYNAADLKKAKEHLTKAGYDGTPIRILTSHQYEFHFKMAEVAKVYLEQAGFKVQLDVVDWATLTERRNNPDLWDIYITHAPFFPEPGIMAILYNTNRIGWKLPEKETVLGAFTQETDPAKRKELFGKLQSLIFSDVPWIKIGNFNSLQAKASSLSGTTLTPWPFFWNAEVK